jgi:DNA-binding beta-propeller fold protein YncE
MKSLQLFLALISLSTFNLSCKGQKSFGGEQLILKQSISLPNVRGRIDHLDVNLQSQIVYMAALGNNSLEAIDIKNGKLLYSIKDLSEPQGVVYIPQTNEVMVANGGNGNCLFYNAQTFANTAKIGLGSDADDVRYDSADQRIYVGYGDGGIAIIDAQKHEKIGDVRLSAHPEGFQIDKAINKIFVNAPDAHQIDVIDLTTMSVTAKWETEFGANFPMAIDKEHHIIFIGYRHPAKIVAINEMTGKTIAVTDLISDVDDIYFDSKTNKQYASGGGGAINVFLFSNSTFTQVANIPTRSGARTSLLIPQLNSFVLAERAGGGPAQLQVYNIKN